MKFWEALREIEEGSIVKNSIGWLFYKSSDQYHAKEINEEPFSYDSLGEMIFAMTYPFEIDGEWSIW